MNTNEKAKKYLQMLKSILPNIDNHIVDGMAMYEIHISEFVNENLHLKETDLVEKVMKLAACEYTQKNGLTIKQKLQLDLLNMIRCFKGKVPKDFVINSYKTFDELVLCVESCRSNKFYEDLYFMEICTTKAFSVRGINTFISQLTENNYRYVVEDKEQPVTYVLDMKNAICYMLCECKVIPINDFIDYLILCSTTMGDNYYSQVANYIAVELGLLY